MYRVIMFHGLLPEKIIAIMLSYFDCFGFHCELTVPTSHFIIKVTRGAQLNSIIDYSC